MNGISLFACLITDPLKSYEHIIQMMKMKHSISFIARAFTVHVVTFSDMPYAHAQYQKRPWLSIWRFE